MKKKMMAAVLAAVMAVGMVSVVPVYADADSKTLVVGFDIRLLDT